MDSRKKKPKDKSNNKKALLIIGSVAGAVVVIAVALVAILSFGRNTQDDNQSDYKIVDLTNKPISEACSIAKANGWEVVEPIDGQYSSTPKVDCSNSYAAVESYHYNKSAHTLKIKWDYHRLTEDEYKDKTVSEICEFGKQYQLTIDPTSSFGSTDTANEYVHSCDDNRIPDRVSQDGKTMYFIFAKESKETSNGASTSSSSSSSASGSSTSSSSSSNNSATNTTLGKCKAGDKYAISENGHYVVGTDIPSGTYAPEKGSISFDIFRTQSKYDSDDSNFIWLTSEAKTVQLNNGNIIDNVISTGYLVCK